MIPKNSVSLGLIGLIRKMSDWFRMNFNPKLSPLKAHSKLIQTCNANESDWIRSNRINPKFQIEWIRSIRISPNDSEKFGFIRINSDKFGLAGFNLFNSDWPDSIGFVQIDFEWVSDWFKLKANFGLDRNETVWCGYKFRNETVWCGYKFRNDSENFGLVQNEF